VLFRNQNGGSFCHGKVVSISWVAAVTRRLLISEMWVGGSRLPDAEKWWQRSTAKFLVDIVT